MSGQQFNRNKSGVGSGRAAEFCSETLREPTTESHKEKSEIHVRGKLALP